jgi:hypothetical protein
MIQESKSRPTKRDRYGTSGFLKTEIEAMQLREEFLRER